MKIQTECVNPPILMRDMDWSAVDDDTYDGEGRIGRGRTEQEAIDDLLCEWTPECRWYEIAKEFLPPLNVLVVATNGTDRWMDKRIASSDVMEGVSWPRIPATHWFPIEPEMPL